MSLSDVCVWLGESVQNFTKYYFVNTTQPVSAFNEKCILYLIKCHPFVKMTFAAELHSRISSVGATQPLIHKCTVKYRNKL